MPKAVATAESVLSRGEGPEGDPAESGGPQGHSEGVEDGKPVGRTFCLPKRHSLGISLTVIRVPRLAYDAESPGRASGLEAGGQRSEPNFAVRPDRADSMLCTSHSTDGAA